MWTKLRIIIETHKDIKIIYDFSYNNKYHTIAKQ